ncbi:effector-associated constant component EACC1 [Actinacidiphila alni]|uniref:effector-associated constant component EACC1 n=1 Tax=Actinacidiphila alni TaxID=380248 RepID=UPI003452A79D
MADGNGADSEGGGEDGGAELRELCAWLRADEDGPDEVRLLPGGGDGTGADGAGAMGPAEVIDLVLTQGVALANLALVYAGWRQSRAHRPPAAGFTFTRASDGLSVTVSGEAGSEEAVRRLLAVLAETPDAAQAQGSPAPEPSASAALPAPEAD